MLTNPTRRQIVNVAGVAAAFAGGAFAIPKYLRGQTASTSPSTPKPASLTFSRDLHGYAHDSLASLSSKCYRGTAGVEHFQTAARSMRLYAHHVETLHLNVVSKAFAKKLQIKDASFRDCPGRDTALARVRKFDSTVGNDIVDSLPEADPAQLSLFKKMIAENGISSMYRFHAQVLDGAAIALGEQQLGNQGTSAHAKQEAYTAVVGRPHIEEICVTKPKVSTRKHICQYLSAGGNLATLGIIFAKAGCAADVLGSVLFDIATDGGAIVLSEAEVALCAWIEANADWMSKVTFSAAQLLLGCSFA